MRSSWTPLCEDILVLAGLRSLRVVFLLTFGSFVLLLFTTFSVPLISTFYFIDVSVPPGVRFGVWGWCYDNGGGCPHPSRIGYSFGSQVESSVTNALALYPIATLLSLLSTLVLVPLLFDLGRPHPQPSATTKYHVLCPSLFSSLSTVTFGVSVLAFLFAIGLWGTAAMRFGAEGVEVRFGPLLWMSLVESVTMGLVSLGAGCGEWGWLCARLRHRTGEEV